MKRYFIWGMGLLGASLGLDLKRRGHYVSGCVRSDKNRQILNDGRFDAIFTAGEESMWDDILLADGLIIGTPIEQIFGILEQCSAKGISTNTWITDMASTKSDLMNWVDAFSEPIGFVGSHPMAGSDLNGPEHAREHLFQKATIYITPSITQKDAVTPEIYDKIVQDVEDFWKSIESIPYVISHKAHDKWAAYLSHGLHLVSCMVSHLLYDIPDVLEMPTPPAAGSFRDITRVAGSNPALWDGIIDSNSTEVTNYLESLENLVRKWRLDLIDGKLPIQDIFKKSGEIRNIMINKNEN
ncbi:MAG: prephenate dehydrogenase [Leptospirales bacterium]